MLPPWVTRRAEAAARDANRNALYRHPTTLGADGIAVMTRRFGKNEFKRIFLYLDVLVVGIFAIALTLLVRDAYVAGFWEARDVSLQSLSMWAMVRDAVFLVASMGWIFVRYFKDKIVSLENPWTS